LILVDSSVWIDYFKGSRTKQTDVLDSLLGTRLLAIGDLMIAEVLQGFREDKAFQTARKLLDSLEVIQIGGKEIAIQAARTFRQLRKQGVTVRATIDTLIATRCIVDGHQLLHDDRDFDAFAKYLGLRTVA
jgi:predicted nucleic acid-binding protein